MSASTSRWHPPAARKNIFVRHAREHNLKGIDVTIPREKFTVITGVSGSGKSTLAFDIIFAEGQRRYLESLNAYARQFVQPASKPDVDAIFGIPPTVAIEQRTSRGGSKSTVATQTEIHHFLRLLFVKLGTQHCPDCNVPIEPQSLDAIAARILKERRNETIAILAPLVVNRKGFYTDLAKWALGKVVSHLRVDGQYLPTNKWPRLDRFREHTLEMPIAQVTVTPANEARAAPRARGRHRGRQGRRARVLRRLGRARGAGLFHEARLRQLRPQLSRARSAALLVQLEARLVRGLLRHGSQDRGHAGRVGRRAREDRHRGPRARFVGRVAGDRRGRARRATASA